MGRLLCSAFISSWLCYHVIAFNVCVTGTVTYKSVCFESYNCNSGYPFQGQAVALLIFHLLPKSIFIFFTLVLEVQCVRKVAVHLGYGT
jgi:hypothetical protein